MKKLMRSISLILAVVMVLGMTVFAAGSTSTSTGDATSKKLWDDWKQIKEALEGDGVSVYPLDGDWLTWAQQYADTRDDLGKVLTVFDMTSENKGFYVTIKYSELVPGKQYALLHYFGENWEDKSKHDNSKWEVILVTYDGSDKLKALITGTSPFGIVEYTGSGSAAVVAPKTGEVIALSAIFALIMMAGAVVCAKKARLQK